MAKRLILDQPPLWLGIRYVFLQGEMLSALNAPISSNALLVQHVAKGSLGDRLGLHAGIIEAEIDEQTMLLGGDIIIKVGGDNLYTTTKGWQRVKNYFHSKKTGEEITLTVLRAGEVLELSAPKP
jgi:serine protease Do